MLAINGGFVGVVGGVVVVVGVVGGVVVVGGYTYRNIKDHNIIFFFNFKL